MQDSASGGAHGHSAALIKDTVRSMKRCVVLAICLLVLAVYGAVFAIECRWWGILILPFPLQGCPVALNRYKR